MRSLSQHFFESQGYQKSISDEEAKIFSEHEEDHPA
jgi:hypothetical protein